MKKLDIAKEIVIVENTVRQYNGQEAYTEEVSNEVATKYASRFNTQQLEDRLAQKLNEREAARKEAYRKEFKNSDEYAKLYKDANEISEKAKNAMKDAISTVVEQVLGSEWGVGKFSITHCEIGLKNTDPQSSRLLEWACTFDFHYRFNLYSDDKEIEFQANIGTTGAFDIDDNDSRSKLYIGFGKFLASPKVQALKDVLKDYSNKIRQNRNQFLKTVENCCQIMHTLQKLA